MARLFYAHRTVEASDVTMKVAQNGLKVGKDFVCVMEEASAASLRVVLSLHSEARSIVLRTVEVSGVITSGAQSLLWESRISVAPMEGASAVSTWVAPSSLLACSISEYCTAHCWG